MKTKREKKLELQLSSCRKKLYLAQQKNRDIIRSRDAYKQKNKQLSCRSILKKI